MITSMGRIDTRDSVNKRSLLDYRYFVIATIISIAYHAIIVFGFSSLLVFEDIEFWMLLLVDTLLIATGLIPVIALIYRKLSWYDPIFWMAILFIGMSGTYFLAYLIDPEYVIYLTSIFGYSEIIHLNIQDFLILIIKAELLLIVFLLIVLYLNRDPISIIPITLRNFEKSAAFSTFLLLFGIATIIILGNWSPASFIDSITVQIGSIEVKQPELGTARYAIMSEIGVLSITLGIIAFLSYSYPKSKLWSNGILLAACLFTILLHVGNGSRIGVIFTVVEYLLIAVWFGYKPHRNVLVFGLVVIMLIVSSITVLRGNRYLDDSSSGVVNQIVTGEAGQLYFSSVSSPVAPLMALDRVRLLAIVVQHLEIHDDFVHGESIVAGFGNLLAELFTRTGLLDQRIDLKWANEAISEWLFYDVVPIGALPPSLPGEFYMQWGWVSFIGFSFVYGWILLILRKKLSTSDTLLSRWLLLAITLRLVFLLPTEISGIAPILLYFPLIIFVYYFMVIFFNKIQSPRFA